ncbi:MAG: heme-dependent peroxidase [Candidatus Eremiobacteraeota bacterium]|nr:heme-dependent peroxidase [Candidatus Eremiobacteraeota bacterium]
MRDPRVPESLEGWWILHRMFRFDRLLWESVGEKRRTKIAGRARDLFEHMHAGEDGDIGLAQLVGHKGDFMLTHYARSYDGLAYAQMLVDKLELRVFLEPMDSYVSVLEVGMYDATGKIHADLAARGLEQGGEEWVRAFDEALASQAVSPYIAPRLWAKIPRRRYTCFYPMDKRRGESVNWYLAPFDERRKMMHEHGLIGRTYAGKLTQVISGSIGYDDFEWGVDLYADDPLIFKKIVYEMRFDEASAKYGEFGSFWSGVQFSPAQLGVFLDGDSVPALED